MSDDRNRKNANFYEENKYYNTNQNDTDNLLDNENYDSAKVLDSHTFPNVEFAEEEDKFNDVRNTYRAKNLEFGDDFFRRNKIRNLK